MAEYIEKRAALDAILAEYPDAHYPEWYAAKIKTLPAAEVTSVVHGRWILPKRGFPSQRVCSVCANTVRQPTYDARQYTPYPYCPYCGAEMDSEA